MLVELISRILGDVEAYPLAAALGYQTLIVLLAVVLVLDAAGWWGIFRKAGQPGWKAIVPLYDEYVRCRVSGTRVELFVVELVFLAASRLLATPQASSLIGAAPTIANVCLALFVFAYAIVRFNTSKSFGGDLGLAAALLFLEPLVSIYLGFGRPAYGGPARPDSRLMPFELDRDSSEGEIVEKDGHLSYRDRTPEDEGESGDE